MQIQTKSPGRKPINLPALTKIANMSGKEVIIKKKDWKLVVPPGAHILRQKLGHEYEVKSLEDGSGWLIKKLK